MAGNQDLAIKLSGRIQGLNNGLTNSKGVLEGLVKGGALGLKETQETALTTWIAATPERQSSTATSSRRWPHSRPRARRCASATRR